MDDSLARRPWPIKVGATLAVAAVVLLLGLGVTLMSARQEVANAQRAAQQAIADSQLYADASEMDADLTEVMLDDDTPKLGSEKLNGLSGFQDDSNTVDADLSKARSFPVNSADRTSMRNTEQDLAAYRTQASAAKAASTRAAGLTAYEQATGLAHTKLLPAALSVGSGPAGRMDTNLHRAHVLNIVSIVLAALLGLTLLAMVAVALLVTRKIWRRKIGAPWVAAALVLTVAVTAAAITMAHVGDTRLRAGQDDFDRFQAGQRATGAEYDMAMDPARYLITGKNTQWLGDMNTADVQVARSLSSDPEAWIAEDVFGRDLRALTIDIDDGPVAPADLSLYNTDNAVHQQFVAVGGFLEATKEFGVTAGAKRLPAARSVYLLWVLIPLLAMMIMLFLIAQIVQPSRRRAGELAP